MGLVAVAAGAAIGTLLLLGPSSGRTPASGLTPTVRVANAASRIAAALPAPHRGFAVPRAHQLGSIPDLSRWAPVLRAVWARRRPDPHSRALSRVSTRSPEGTTNLVEFDGSAERDGTEWIRTRPAMLPNDSIGWIPRSALGGWTFVDTRLIVDRRTLTLTLLRRGRPVFRAPIGVGKPATPTPAGTFYVRDRLTRFASPEYGPIAFGTSARSAVETDWPAGGFIGIHGTDEPQLIPGRISHGCIRLRNAAIRSLARLMPVGTPVIIR